MRKSTYRRRLDPMASIIKRMPLADDQTRDIGIAYRISLQTMLQGHGTEQSWSTLACALNMALLLSEYGIGTAALPTIKLAQEALLRVRERAGRSGKWMFDGEGVRVILAAVNIHDAQISRATRGQVVTALAEVHRRVTIGEAA